MLKSPRPHSHHNGSIHVTGKTKEEEKEDKLHNASKYHRHKQPCQHQQPSHKRTNDIQQEQTTALTSRQPRLLRLSRLTNY